MAVEPSADQHSIPSTQVESLGEIDGSGQRHSAAAAAALPELDLV
jgi:hypothetical protein